MVWPLLWGALLALCMPPLPLGILAPIPLAFLLAAKDGRAGFLAGVGFWGVCLVWLPQSFVIQFDSWWGAVPFIPLVLIKALSWGLVFGLTRQRPLARVGALVVLEYLSSLSEVAFPWGLLGYALVDAPGRILASVGGVFLLSLVVGLVAYALQQRRYAWAALWLGLWVLPLPSATPTHTALLVQGNIDPVQKAIGQASPESIYLTLSAQGLQKYPTANPVVWPETAVQVLWPQVASLMAERELITGISPPEPGFPNRVLLYQNAQTLAQRDKHHLAPFGEYFPFQEALSGVYGFFFRSLGLGNLGSRMPGQDFVSLGRYAAYICYESVFPGLTRRLVREGGEVLVLPTNDAWFGPSYGAEQHFQMGRLRAVETGRWLLRAGNDGVTASVDPYGRVVARLPQRTQGYLEAPYAFSQTQTPYVRFGDWAVWAALVLGGVAWRRKR